MASHAPNRTSPVIEAAEALLKLSLVGKGKNKSPVVHVLMADGRTTEFARRAIVLPESGPDEASQQIYALLINGKGEVMVQPDGQPAVTDLSYAIANEAGAADYSDSPVAREEFPNLDRMTQASITSSIDSFKCFGFTSC